MHQCPRQSVRDGFTLIEVLVTLLLLSLLAAAVFPVITQQVSRGEPVKASQDLSSIRTGIETFSLNVRPSYPGDLEDLIAQITTSDLAIRRGSQTVGFGTVDSTRWNGPYIDASVIDGGSLTTGFGVPILDDFTRFDATNNAPFGSANFSSNGTSLFVAVQLGTPGRQLSAAQFAAINDLVDGDGEPEGPGPNTSWTLGKLRFNNSLVAADTLAYYLAVPIEQ
jgi:prepilin-type N-terminal cleavage/methylation domain-containing protein